MCTMSPVGSCTGLGDSPGGGHSEAFKQAYILAQLFPFWNDCFTFWDIIHSFGVAEQVGWAAAVTCLIPTLTLAVLFHPRYLSLLPMLLMSFEKWG